MGADSPDIEQDVRRVVAETGVEHEDGRRVVVAAFADGLGNDGDGALALARIGEAVAAWLRTGSPDV